MASQTSAAWQLLDRQISFRDRALSHGPVLIGAEEIKRIGGREPRLMTKWDSREARPKELSGITILPVANGEYLLLAGDGYHDIEPPSALRRWVIPPHIQGLETLPWSQPPASESQAIDVALSSGLLCDFLNEEAVYLTIRGRLRTGRFGFTFTTDSGALEAISVDGVQTEVDAGLEGERGIYLLEAKLGSWTNIHCRQLYYPYRMWRERARNKPVYSVYLSWANQCFVLRKYTFQPYDRYQSIRLLEAVDYVMGDPTGVPSIDAITSRTTPSRLPEKIPFPQADDLAKVIDVVDSAASGLDEQGDIIRRFGFVGRQADYYGNAAVFLGLLTKSRRRYEPTEAGRQFITARQDERLCLLTERIVSMPVFREATLHWLERGELPDLPSVVEWIAEHTGLNGTTPIRRAKTVAAWIRWLAAAHRAQPIEPSGKPRVE